MGRGKIERETKREKENFAWEERKRKKEEGIAAFKKIAKEERAKGCHLREDSQGGESKVLPPLRKIICVCESKEK